MDKEVLVQLNQLDMLHKLVMVLKGLTHKHRQDMDNNHKHMAMILQVTLPVHC